MKFFHWAFSLVGFIAWFEENWKMVRWANIIPTCLAPITCRRYLKMVIGGEMSRLIHFTNYLYWWLSFWNESLKSKVKSVCLTKEKIQKLQKNETQQFTENVVEENRSQIGLKFWEMNRYPLIRKLINDNHYMNGRDPCTGLSNLEPSFLNIVLEIQDSLCFALIPDWRNKMNRI